MSTVIYDIQLWLPHRSPKDYDSVEAVANAWAATVSYKMGGISLQFSLVSHSLQSAIDSAIADVRNSYPDWPIRVEMY